MAEKLCSGKPPKLTNPKLVLNESGEPELVLDESTKAQLEFNKATFKLGLRLIDDYTSGRCRDSDKILDAIIKIMEVQPKAIWRD